MSEQSARFALPYILPGQAQKELFHNEALALLDGLLHATVAGVTADPPDGAAPGDVWIVGAAATGAWAGRDNALAIATSGGWRLIDPVAGMMVWDDGAGFARRWADGGWSEGMLAGSGILIGGEQVVGPRQPDVPSPSGGSTIDVEARTAINGLIVTLKSHGLID